jgi:hypothetical protein
LISSARRQLPLKAEICFLNAPHACKGFLLRREKNGRDTISRFHLSVVVHNSASPRPTNEIIATISDNFHGRERKIGRSSRMVAWYHSRLANWPSVVRLFWLWLHIADFSLCRDVVHEHCRGIQ